MAGNNQIYLFAGAGGANVQAPSDWLANPSRLSGFVAGTADATQANTAWRQALFVATMIAQFTADYSNQNVNDDANVPVFETNFIGALFQVMNQGNARYCVDTGT